MSTYESQQQYPEPPQMEVPNSRSDPHAHDDRRAAMMEALEAFQQGSIAGELMMDLVDAYAGKGQQRGPAPAHNAMAAGGAAQHFVGNPRTGYQPARG